LSQRPSLDDYVDVAERILIFAEKYPEGSLQTLAWDVREVGEKTFIVYHAAAYRHENDERPGHGIAWEPFPGPTPYTKDSELMNAETSAWGRAIVALGLSSKKIASKQEVKARTGSPSTERVPNPRIPVDRAQAILQKAVKVGLATLNLDAEPGTPPEFHAVLKAQLALLGVDKIGELDSDTAEAMEAFLANETEAST
jgi:hypothetical protein